MNSSPVRKVIQTNVSDEMYNCINNLQALSPQSSLQHQNASSTNNNNQPNPPAGSSSQGNGSSPIHQNGSSGYSDRNNKMQGFEITDEIDAPSYAEDSVLTQQGRTSNENLLGTAFCTFMGFALVQTVVAIFAGSEAMLGDSAAMIVDALTYLFNWFAERKKATYENREWRQTVLTKQQQQQPEDAERILARTKRKNVLQLELIPPLLSVSTLVVVTAFVLNQSIRVLILDVHRGVEKQGNPNIHIMMYFSIANLGLDLVNVANFAKAKHLFGYETSEELHGHEALSSTDGDVEDVDKMYHTTRRAPSHDEMDECDEDQDHTANLNMCSAYTHVFADTLRSIAVLVAACLSELIEGITPEEADASAAVVVSGLILLSLVPLIKGLMESYNELRLIKAEEKNAELL